MTTPENPIPVNFVNTLGKDYDPNSHLEDARLSKGIIEKQLEILKAETGMPGLKAARSLVKTIGSELRACFKIKPRPSERIIASKTYEIFYSHHLTPKSVEAVTQVLEYQKQTAADRRLARKLTFWEDYFSNQAERDTAILASLQSNSEPPKAPEQMLNLFRNPDTYHPRGKNKALVAFALERMSKETKTALRNRKIDLQAMINEEAHRLGDYERIALTLGANEAMTLMADLAELRAKAATATNGHQPKPTIKPIIDLPPNRVRVIYESVPA